MAQKTLKMSLGRVSSGMSKKSDVTAEAAESAEVVQDVAQVTNGIVYLVKGSTVWPCNITEKKRVKHLEKDGFVAQEEKPTWH